MTPLATRFSVPAAGLVAALVAAAAIAACGDDVASLPPPAADAGDAGLSVVVLDAGEESDGGRPTLDDDAGTPDAGRPTLDDDAGTPDTGTPDAGPVTPPVDPAQPGTLGSAQPTRIKGSISVGNFTSVAYEAVLPAKVPAPLLVFAPGFTIGSSNYDSLMVHLASHGFVALRCDPRDLVSHEEGKDDLLKVIDEALAPNGKFAGKVDATKVGLLGHSKGGKLATMVAARDPRVKALLGLDPVNGFPPGGFCSNDNGCANEGGKCVFPRFQCLGTYSAENPDLTPAEVGLLSIPVGFMGQTIDSGIDSCAPADQNFATFFDAATTSPWAASWNFLSAHHNQFVDDLSACQGRWNDPLWCRACRGSSGSDAGIRTGVRTLTTAFFLRHLAGDTTMDRYLLGPAIPGGVVANQRIR